ncbi:MULTISPECIES: Slp family lipoprotein [unclassified Wenzhouxiangella]|uniref:Slp family lipoprotein n=1 Tax=unclassified Wenzhouxiangella TaxID=2613841 RepID=UPI0015F27824|nr:MULTISPECIES: Slp family lipoprotein [unclassified Wenzhouxiangella]
MKVIPMLSGLVLSALLVAGCATVPEPLGGEFEELTPEQSGDQHVGQQVRWGGSIVDTRPGKSETCIEVLARSLDSRARPHSGDDDRGRFLACRDGFEDPAVFERGRDITVVGTLTGFVEGNIGEFRYVYPRVEADTLFLWGEEVPARYYHDPWYYRDPWWPYARFPWSHSRWHFSGHVIIR